MNSILLKRIITGLIMNYTYILIILINLSALLITFYEYFSPKKGRSKTFTKLTNSDLHKDIEKKTLWMVFYALLINISIYLYVFDSQYRSNSILSQNDSFSSFLNLKNEKNTQEFTLKSQSFYYLSVFFLYTVLFGLIPEENLAVIIFIVLIRVDSLLDYIAKRILSYDIGLIEIICFIGGLEIISLIISYIYLYYYVHGSDSHKITQSDEIKNDEVKNEVNKNDCLELARKHFDYVGYMHHPTSVNVMNGPIFHKQALIFLGDTDVFTDKELYSIILHEIGHSGNIGVHLTYLSSILIKLLLVGLFYYVSEIYTNVFFVYNKNAHLFFFSSMVPAIFYLNAFLHHLINHQIEYMADDYSIREGYGYELISSLVKLCYKNGVTNKLNWMANLITSTHPCTYFRALNYDNQIKSD